MRPCVLICVRVCVYLCVISIVKMLNFIHIDEPVRRMPTMLIPCPAINVLIYIAQYHGVFAPLCCVIMVLFVESIKAERFPV